MYICPGVPPMQLTNSVNAASNVAYMPKESLICAYVSIRLLRRLIDQFRLSEAGWLNSRLGVAVFSDTFLLPWQLIHIRRSSISIYGNNCKYIQEIPCGYYFSSRNL